MACHNRESGTGTKLRTFRRLLRCGFHLAARVLASAHARASLTTVSGSLWLADTVYVISQTTAEGHAAHISKTTCTFFDSPCLATVAINPQLGLISAPVMCLGCPWRYLLMLLSQAQAMCCCIPSTDVWGKFLPFVWRPTQQERWLLITVA